MSQDIDVTAVPDGWERPFHKLREKWGTIPTGVDRRQGSAYLLTLSDEALLAEWNRATLHDTTGEGFGVRGWYHEMYRTLMPGKKVLDVGCGMGTSSICFAEMGAKLTFCDIVQDNVRVVERVCKIKGIQANFLYIEDIESYDALPYEFDVVTAIGSLINAPLAVTKREIDRLKQHLRVGGRWLHLAYPKARWLREGSVDFSRWGEMTDGEGTPWMIYHNKQEIEVLFRPSKIRFLFECEWHNNDFNWFDFELIER